MDNANQNAWNFASLFVYFILLVTVAALIEVKGIDITETGAKDLIFIILATYRLTRIIVFEKIFKFFRDWVKARTKYAVLNTLRFIITCPWCMGVWMSLIVVLFFYIIPYGKIIVYIMGVSGVASFIIVTANYMVLSVNEKQDRRNSRPHGENSGNGNSFE
jgi:hypothetical protein